MPGFDEARLQHRQARSRHCKSGGGEGEARNCEGEPGDGGQSVTTPFGNRDLVRRLLRDGAWRVLKQPNERLKHVSLN